MTVTKDERMRAMNKENIHNGGEQETICLEELASELGITLKNFKIEIKKEVKEILLTLSKAEQEVLLNAIYHMPEGELNKLSGCSDVEGLYSLKVDNFRITYTAQKDVITIIILKQE